MKCNKCGSENISENFSRDAFSLGYTFACIDCGNILPESD